MNENGLIKIELENILYCFHSSFCRYYHPLIRHFAWTSQNVFFSSLPLLKSMVFVCMYTIVICGCGSSGGCDDGGGGGV